MVQANRLLQSKKPIADDFTTKEIADQKLKNAETDKISEERSESINDEEHNDTESENIVTPPNPANNLNINFIEEPGYLNADQMLGTQPDTEPPFDIQSTMDSVAGDILNVVARYMRELKIPETQPAILDSIVRWPASWRGLMDEVLGPIDYHDTHACAELMNAFHRTGTRLDVFLQSFIASAVTSWCLNCDGTDEERYHNGLGEGSLKRTFEKGRSLTAEAYKLRVY